MITATMKNYSLNRIRTQLSFLVIFASLFFSLCCAAWWQHNFYSPPYPYQVKKGNKNHLPCKSDYLFDSGKYHCGKCFLYFEWKSCQGFYSTLDGNQFNIFKKRCQKCDEGISKSTLVITYQKLFKKDDSLNVICVNCCR